MTRILSFQPTATTGGVTQGFTIVQPPNGTSPTASSGASTLTFASTGNNNIVITGNAASNTINFSLRSPIVDTLSVASVDWNSRLLLAGDGSNAVEWGSYQLYVAGNLSLDWAGQTLFSNSYSYVNSLNWSACVLIDPVSDVTSVNWQQRILIDSSNNYRVIWEGSGFIEDDNGIICLEMSNRFLDDTSENPSVDWGNRILYDGSNNQSVNWNNYVLLALASTTILDWGNQLAYDDVGVLSIQWSNRQLLDAGDVPSLDWNNRQLLDSSLNQSLFWDARYMVDASDVMSVDWGNRVLRNASGTLILDWANEYLQDLSGVISVAWALRELSDTGSGVQFAWSTLGVQITNKISAYGGITTAGLGVDLTVGYAVQTAKTSSITSTTLVASALAKIHRIQGVLIVTTSGTGGTVAGAVSYTDLSNTAQTLTLSSIVLSTLGNSSTLNVVIWPKAGTAITYTTTVTSALGSPQYAVTLSASTS